MKSKRIPKWLAAAALAIALLASGATAYSAGVMQKIDVALNSLTVKVNGTKLDGSNIVYKGNVYVQADKASKALHKNFAWDKKKNTVSITDIKKPVLEQFNVEYLRFFESGDEIPDQEKRVYKDAFPISAARYVNWEIALDYEMQKQDTKFNLYFVYYKPDGTLFAEEHDNDSFYAVKGWTSSVHTWGHGYSEPGLWEPGVYRAEVWINGVKVAEGSFEMYDDKAEDAIE